MSAQLKSSIKSIFLRLAIYQLLMITGLSLIMLLIKGIQSSLSFFAGGIACWLPSTLFVWRLSRYAGAHAALRFVLAFFIGEGLKLFFSGILFLLFITYLNVNLMYTLFGLLAAIVAFWVASIISLMSSRIKI